MANDITWAQPADYSVSKSATLATSTAMADPEFREKAIAMDFLLAEDGLDHYIGEQIKKEKEVYGKDWEFRRTEVVSINDPRVRGWVKYNVRGLESVMLVKVSGLFASTRQFAHVGLSGKDYKGLPVIYIDGTFANTPDKCVQKHDIDEILQWENLRLNILRIGMRSYMRQWIVKHIDKPDDELKDTEYEGLTSRQIAKMFHKNSYPLDSLFGKLKIAADYYDAGANTYLDYEYLRLMLSLYGTDEESSNVNIAAKGAFDPSFKGKRRTGVGRWELLKQFRQGLTGLPADKVAILRGIEELGKIRKFLVDSGLDMAQEIDGKFLIQEVEEFLRQRPVTASDQAPVRRNKLYWAGEGRKLVAYWADDFDFIVKMRRDKEEVKLEDILKQWIEEGCRIASERLNGLAVQTMVIDATGGLKKPFSYILESRGVQKTDLAIVQRKVIPLLDQMKYLVKEGKVSQAKDLVDRYKELIVAMFKRGVIDLDFTYPYNNCGVDSETGKMYVFDFGDLCDNERDLGIYFENLGVTNKFFYDDLRNQVDKEVAGYFAMFPLTEDDFYTPQGESLFGVDLKSGNAERFKMAFYHSEDEIRAIFMNHTMNHSDAELPPPGSIYSVFEFICDNTPEGAIGITGQEIADKIEKKGDIGRAYSTIDPDIRALLYHLKLIQKPNEDKDKTGKHARYYVPESVKKKQNQLLPILEQFQREDLRPGAALLDKIYNDHIKPILEASESTAAQTVSLPAFKELQEYLAGEDLRNSPEAIAKATQILTLYSEEGKQILLELCGGDTEVAHAIAENNKNMGVLTVDRYSTSDEEYGSVAKKFDNKELKAQKYPLENLVVLRADQNIFKYLSDNYIDNVLLVAPSYLEEILAAPGIKEKIKSSVGKIIVKPYIYFTFLHDDPDKPPQEILCKDYLFKNTNSSSMFGVNIDKKSDYSAGEPLFVWRKEDADSSGLTAEPKSAAAQPSAGEIENALHVMDKLMPAQLKYGRYYEVRYDSSKLRVYRNDANLSKDSSPEELLQEYIRCLRMRVNNGEPKDVIDLKEFNGETSKGEYLISVTCYADETKNKVVGEGKINIKDLDKTATIQIIGMLNMAFAASHIPAGADLSAYDKLVSFLKSQYKGLTGKDLSLKDIWGIIELPAAKIIHTGTLAEYYRLTIEQLQQNA